MIDPTKIRVGDEVTWTTYGTVTSVDGGNSIGVDGEWIGISRILSHTPAPRPFVVGGKVRSKARPTEAKTILAEHGDWLWIHGPEFCTAHKDNWEPCD